MLPGNCKKRVRPAPARYWNAKSVARERAAICSVGKWRPDPPIGRLRGGLSRPVLAPNDARCDAICRTRNAQSANVVPGGPRPSIGVPFGSR
jgi:hypothetical protein